MKVLNIKFQAFIIAILTIVLLILISMRATNHTIDNHQLALKKLHQLKHQISSVNEQVLRAQQGLLRNYDDIVKSVQEIPAKVDLIIEKKEAMSHQEIDNSIQHLELLQKAANSLKDSTEQFLTAHAILNNSLSSLPILIGKLTTDSVLANSRLIQKSEQLLNQIFLYIRWHEPETKKEITTLLNQLQQENIGDDLTKREIINFVIAHSKIILTKTLVETKTLEQILSEDVMQRFLQVHSDCVESFNYEIKQLQYMDWAIYLIALILVAFIFLFLFALHRSTQSLEKEMLFLNTLLDTISDGVVACDNKGEISLYNKAIAKLHGIEDQSLDPKHWNEQCLLYDSSSKTPLTDQARPLARALNDELIENQEFIIQPVSENSLPITISIHGSSIIDSEGHRLGAVISIQNTTAHKTAEIKLRRNADEERVFSKLLELSFKPLEEFLQQAAIEIVSLEWLSILPKSGIFLTDDQGDSETLSLFCHFKLAPELLTLCAKVPFGRCLCGSAAKEKTIQYAHCVDHRHENLYPGIPGHGHYNVPLLQDEKVLGVIVLYLPEGHQKQDHEIAFLQRVAHIISLGISRKYAEKKAQYLAYHDTLTKLPNRLLLMNRLKQVSALAKRMNRHTALIYIDFDHFKHINDSLGHAIGDLLLQELSQRCQQVVREEDTVARLGGDEFVLLITELANDLETATSEVQQVISKLQTILAKEFVLGGHSLHISMSAGIVILTGEEDDFETLLMQADTAMYQAKAAGRNTVRFFLPEMQEKALARVLLEKDLRLALPQQELSVYYQPQMDVEGILIGAEGLLRWKHKKMGFVSPFNFIPIAEETGLIIEIGQFVLRDACNKINQWQACETLAHIAVNVSPVQFRQQDYVDSVKMILAETQADPTKLTLELTEGILVDDVEQVIEKMQALKQLGIHFSVDDFGTGYSSLAYLKRFPLDQLKIDKSFVDDIYIDENDHVIIETIIAMADRLGFNLIAEGVETEEQLTYLKENGCYNYQGYYFSKPVDADTFSEKYM